MCIVFLRPQSPCWQKIAFCLRKHLCRCYSDRLKILILQLKVSQNKSSKFRKMEKCASFLTLSVCCGLPWDSGQDKAHDWGCAMLFCCVCQCCFVHQCCLLWLLVMFAGSCVLCLDGPSSVSDPLPLRWQLSRAGHQQLPASLPQLPVRLPAAGDGAGRVSDPGAALPRQDQSAHRQHIEPVRIGCRNPTFVHLVG